MPMRKKIMKLATCTVVMLFIFLINSPFIPAVWPENTNLPRISVDKDFPGPFVAVKEGEKTAVVLLVGGVTFVLLTSSDADGGSTDNGGLPPWVIRGKDKG
jgi:hypothetical protein